MRLAASDPKVLSAVAICGPLDGSLSVDRRTGLGTKRCSPGSWARALRNGNGITARLTLRGEMVISIVEVFHP